MAQLAIIITGYNRPHALKALFESMQKLCIDPSVKIPLIISIDNKGTDEVNQLVHEFKWRFGDKEVIIHQEKKGLVKHFLWVGDQTLKYERILFLEDDFIVSPDMINYALQVIEFYEDDDNVAGATLYNSLYSLHGIRFYQIQDGYDNYFFQHPYWGNIWFKNKWLQFKEYLKTYKENKDILPLNIDSWNESFKKIFIQYLIETNRTMVAPRISLVSNNGIAGLHTLDAIQWQVPFIITTNIKYRFSTFEQSMAKYDAFEELYVNILKKMNPSLMNYDFELDTKCLKKRYDKPYVITCNPSIKNPIMAFSASLKPMELAIGLNIQGNGLYFIKNSAVSVAYNYITELNYDDFNRNNIFSTKMILNFLKKMVKQSLLRKIKFLKNK